MQQRTEWICEGKACTKDNGERQIQGKPCPEKCDRSSVASNRKKTHGALPGARCKLSQTLHRSVERSGRGGKGTGAAISVDPVLPRIVSRGQCVHGKPCQHTHTKRDRGAYELTTKTFWRVVVTSNCVFHSDLLECLYI